ncbi:MAG TPA: ATP-grasp domain-containing protein, partial [Xanthomonadales bacterium]|nr:ATP-grasp domain-containing protein [Xanthomonadales bacterium]
PYHAWLGEWQEPIVVFSLRSEADDQRYALVERFASFDADGLAEERAVALHERYGFTHVFALSEYDLIRAARLRERFAIAGQSYESAIAYRDKLVMKRLVAAAGVRTPAFAELESPGDLRRFVAAHGLPCVVKPRRLAGGRGVRVLHTREEIDELLSAALPPDTMVESFVGGTMFHVDGLVTAGAMLFSSASRYLTGCLSYQDGVSSAGTLLDPASPLSQRLIAVAKRVVAALPCAPHFAFHAEFFVDAGRIVFCEIAARPGGARIAETIEYAYGLNVYEQCVRGSFGLPVEFAPQRPWRAAGRLFVPPRRARLQSIPERVRFPWVVDYRPNAKPGDCLDAPDCSASHVASFIVVGADTAQVERRMTFLDTWFRNHLMWEDLPRTSSA